MGEPNGDGTEPLFVSLGTAEYLPQLLALRSSLDEAYGGRAALAALVIGSEAAVGFARGRGIDAVGVDELAIPSFWDMAFRYEKGALANALKPFFIAHVMRTRRARTAVFLDADTLVYSPLDELHALLADDAVSVVLTPHFERPQVRTREPFESDLLRAGITNGGFVALRAGNSAEAFLAWWSDHMRKDCRYELEKGLYGDQHWLDLAPSLFDGVRILRHRGYNASYWNYPDRRPRREAGRWLIDADPLRFFHFSQWRIGQGETVDACLERLFQGGDDELRTLLARYREAWRVAAATVPREVVAGVYPYGRFLDGTPIPKIVRDAYAAQEALESSDREENFGRGLQNLLAPSDAFPAFDGVVLPALFVHIWRLRPDLHNGRIDLGSCGGQLALLEWILSNGAADYALPDAAVELARRGLEGCIDVALPPRGHAEKLREGARASLAKGKRLHAASVSTETELGALLAQAGSVLGALFALAGFGEAPRPADCEGLFAEIDRFKSGLAGKAGADGLAEHFGRIEGHRRYWAEKRVGASGAEPGRNIALDADTVINTCGDLLAVADKLILRGRYPSPGQDNAPAREPIAKAG